MKIQDFFLKFKQYLFIVKKLRGLLILSLWKSVKYYSPLVSGIYPIINLLLKKIFFFFGHTTWDIISPTRDPIWGAGSESAES